MTLRIAGTMPHDTTDQKKHVYFAKASSRKELAQTVHEFVVPMLAHYGSNLEFLKKEVDSLKAEIATLKGAAPKDADERRTDSGD